MHEDIVFSSKATILDPKRSQSDYFPQNNVLHRLHVVEHAGVFGFNVAEIMMRMRMIQIAEGSSEVQL